MNNLYKNFEKKLLNLPLWVKEVVYYMLKKDIQEMLPCSDIDILKEDLHQYFCPEITYSGRKELERLSSLNDTSEVFYFLDSLVNDMNIIEISINNGWTLEETSLVFCECCEKQYVSTPTNPVIGAKLAYFASKIRIGEYFKRIGLIDADQLESAIRIQKENELSEVKKGFASILIDLNLVNRNDTDNVLLIKQESKRRFALNFSTEGQASFENIEDVILVDDYAKKIEKLEYENKVLKSKLREILNIK